jgi:GAF domain-containing protein
MNTPRFTVMPEERFQSIRPAVEARIQEAARELPGPGFDLIFDGGMRAVLIEAFRAAGAHEGTIWLLNCEQTALIPVFNSGPHATAFVGQFEQPLANGMISLVIASEQPLCENQVWRNSAQDKALDDKLGLRTHAMIAVPLVFSGQLRGVISCVQLQGADSSEPDPPGFQPEHLRNVQLTSSVIGRLIDARLLALCLGLTQHP